MMAVGAGNVIGSLFGSRLIARLGLYRSLLTGVLTMGVLYCLVPLAPNLGVALTLLALVMAFAGVDETRRLYRTAIEERYRFYSFGDAMLIL